jgi:hypothetical protein
MCEVRKEVDGQNTLQYVRKDNDREKEVHKPKKSYNQTTRMASYIEQFPR